MTRRLSSLKGGGGGEGGGWTTDNTPNNTYRVKRSKETFVVGIVVMAGVMHGCQTYKCSRHSKVRNVFYQAMCICLFGLSFIILQNGLNKLSIRASHRGVSNKIWFWVLLLRLYFSMWHLGKY